MDTLAQRFRAGRFDRWEAVAQHRGEDADHLAVAIGNTGEFAANPLEPTR
jgi:hypothetical protein